MEVDRGRRGESWLTREGEGNIKRHPDWPHHTHGSKRGVCIIGDGSRDEKGSTQESDAQAAASAQGLGGVERAGPEQQKVEATG